MPRHNKRKFKKKKTKKVRNKRGKNRHKKSKKRKIKIQRGGWPPSNDPVPRADNPAPAIWGTAATDIRANREGRWRANKIRRRAASTTNDGATEVKWVGGAAAIADRVETLAGTPLLGGEQLEFTAANPRKLKIRVKFDSPDAGYYDLKNPKVAKVIADCEAEAATRGKTVDDILFQTDSFWLGDRNSDAGKYITISFKLFGRETLAARPTYERGLMDWDELECDAYTGTRAGVSEATIKGTPCSAGNTERRIFYKVKGNFFHFLKGLNDGTIARPNYIIWFHVANHIFRTNSGNRAFNHVGGRDGAIMVYSHNEDVPFFHLKAGGPGHDGHKNRAKVRNLAFNRNRNDDDTTNARDPAELGSGMQTPAGVAEKIGDITNIPSIYGYSIRNTPAKRYRRYDPGPHGHDYQRGIALQCIRQGQLPRVKYSAPDLIVCRGNHYTQADWDTYFGNGARGSGDAACAAGRFNMDIWRGRLENPGGGGREDISYWSLNPPVASSYAAGGNAWILDDAGIARMAERNVDAATGAPVRPRGVGVFIIARFDFRGGNTRRGQRPLPSGIIFETDNHKNKKIGVRPFNPGVLSASQLRAERLAHTADFAGIATLAGVEPSRLAVRGLSSRMAGVIACQTIQACGTFAPHNIAGIYIPHNLAQLVLSGDSYQYVKYLEAIVYNYQSEACTRHVFPLGRTLPVPGQTLNWDAVAVQTITVHRTIQPGIDTPAARQRRIEWFCRSYKARVAAIKQQELARPERYRLAAVDGIDRQIQLGQKPRRLGNWQSIGRTYIRQLQDSPGGAKRNFLRRLIGQFDAIRRSAANGGGGAAAAPAGITYNGLTGYNTAERAAGRAHLTDDEIRELFWVLSERNPSGMILPNSWSAMLI